MAGPFAKGFSTAYKRARSQDSPTPLPSPPVLKATKIEEEKTDSEDEIPAFLRQKPSEVRAKFSDLNWREKFRILQGRRDASSEWRQNGSAEAFRRNRYRDVVPWEKSRVHLQVAEGQSDYINASHISLRDPRTGIETNYIATQGPKEIGVSHFWQMIWKETTDVAVIVMLTQTYDGPNEKCFQYFPLTTEAEAFDIDSIDPTEGSPSGSLTVRELTPHPESKTDIRKMCLQFGEKTKEVWHFLFSGWNDFAVPDDEDLAALLELLRISTEKNGSTSNPKIIHCSAGVGRSGTFITLEHLLARVESGAIAGTKENEDVIFETVNRLREQRMTMVQNEAQYQFLYDVIREQLKKRQLDQQASGQPSPKLRKLASGMKSAALGGRPNEDGDLDGGEGRDQHTENVNRGTVAGEAEEAVGRKSEGQNAKA